MGSSEMERVAVEYLVNALWQVPALALGAWALLRMWKPSPAAQHRVWIAVLALGLMMPLRGVVRVGEQPGAGAGNPAAMTPAVMATPAAGLSSVSLDSMGEPGGMVLGQHAGGSWFDHVAREFAPVAAAASLHRVRVSATAAWWSVGLWLAAVLWGLLRMARAWSAARRLVADSREIALGEKEAATLLECARRMGVGPPEVRESDGIAGPVVVGAFAPVLLWPESMARRSGDEQRAALCHELAHIRRRDYAMNLLCELAAVPLKWHPATHAVGRRIRTTREMACDAMAAEAMESETVYAECLVRLARSILEGGLAAESAGAGLFSGNVMEERVMRLMRHTETMSLRARVVRGAAGAAAMAAVITFTGMFHVVPAMAQAVPPAPPAPAVAPVPAPPPPPSAPVAPVQAGTPAPLATPTVPPAPPVPKVAAVPAVPKVPAMPAVPKVPAVPAVPKVPAVLAVPKVPAVLAVPKVPAYWSQRSTSVVIPDGQGRDLTPAERARIKKQLEDAQKKIAEATAKIDSPEFRKQMEDAQAAMLQAQTILNSAEFKQKMADAQKQIAEAEARWNSPQYRKQIADAWKQIAATQAQWNSAEFQKQMDEAQKQVADALAKMKAGQEKQQKK